MLIKFGTLFQSSSLLVNEFFSLLEENGEKTRKPIKVADQNWFSVLKGAKQILNLWPFLCQFIDNSSNTSKKLKKIRTLLVML
jgi:hypothetical protein